jgi:hypothetical protein
MGPKEEGHGGRGEMKITDRVRLESVMRWAKESFAPDSTKTLWSYNLLDRRQIDAALRAKAQEK